MRSLAAVRAAFDSGSPPKLLLFWGHEDRAGAGVGPFVLSQWWPAPIVAHGVVYKSAEHWMMAHKARLFGDDETLARILAAASPGEAKKLGRLVQDFDEETWVEHRSAIVELGSLLKFHQRAPLRRWLLQTGERVLVEASPLDRVWGIGLAPNDPLAADPHAWRGENLLGFALMKARDRLRELAADGDPARDDAIDDDPIAPPWQRHPDIDPYDIFWRMGAGESELERYRQHWAQLTPRERTRRLLGCPPAGAWIGLWLGDDDAGDADA